MWCNVNFGSVFYAFTFVVCFNENKLKITLHQMGILYYLNYPESEIIIQFKIWKVTFLKVFFTTKNYEMDFEFSRKFWKHDVQMPLG